MADIVILSKFPDESFFNIPIKNEYWDRIRSGQEGNFYLQRLAGQMASENDISLTSYQITEGELPLKWPPQETILPWDSLRKKWSNTKIWSKAIVDSNKKTDQRRSRWNYYSRTAEILEEDPSVIPPVTISSLGGVKVNILSEISSILQGATPTKEPYQEQQGISQETTVSRKRRRSNNKLSEQLQSYFERSLAIQAAMLVEERKKNRIVS